MGGYYETVADVEATEAGAPNLAETIVWWLADEGIILEKRSPCVASSDAGYPPGPRAVAALSAPDNNGIPRLGYNGLDVQVGRRVFHPLGGVYGPVICPRCTEAVVLQDLTAPPPAMTAQWELFSDALNSWYHGGSAEVQCPHCAATVEFNDWHWIGQWPFAVGFLGFTFWNWPPLSAQFIAGLASRLGHRVVVTRGRL